MVSDQLIDPSGEGLGISGRGRVQTVELRDALGEPRQCFDRFEPVPPVPDGCREQSRVSVEVLRFDP